MSRSLWILAITAAVALAGAGWLATREAPSTAPAAPVPDVDTAPIPGATGGDTPPAGLDARVPPLSEQVAGRVSWPLPPGLQVPGVTHSTLARNLEEWLESLPPDQRARARDFATRYAVGYSFESPEQQAWMLQHGYPALEEVVAFDFEAMTAQCDRVFCTDPKISALAADESLNRAEEALLEWHGVTEMPASPMEGLDVEQQRTLFMNLFNATSYTRHARELGSRFFAAQLEARERRLKGDVRSAQVIEAYLSACGDPRFQAQGQDQLPSAVMISIIPGNPCGYSPSRPTFPGR
jgi:hypothetical protein